MEKLTKTNYVDLAENVIKGLVNKDDRGKENISLTTSKIRNLFSLVNSLYNEVAHMRSKSLDDNMQGKLQYLRLRFAYEAGRDADVKKFVEESNMISYIKTVTNRSEALLLCRYMEALVAYHKFYANKDRR